MLNGALNYTCIDIGPTKLWGHPLPTSNTSLFKRYPDAIANFNERHFDVVFVDGRFRVACVLRALWFTDKSSVVLLHDYNLERKLRYQVVTEFYDTVALVDTLLILRPKSCNLVQHAKLLRKAAWLLQTKYYQDSL